MPTVSTFVWNSKDDRAILSPGAQSLLGHAGPVTMDDFFLCVHPEDRMLVQAEMIARLERGGSATREFRLLRPDGTTRHVLSHSTLDAAATSGQATMTGVLIDVTASRVQKADIALPDWRTLDPDAKGAGVGALADDTFWRLVDTAPFGVMAVDADLRIARVSRNALATFGGIKRLVGRDLGAVLRKMWPEPFATTVIERYCDTLATGERYQAEPMIEERADSRVLEAYDWTLERIVMEDGRYGVLCYFYDLSERVRNERALERQGTRLSIAYDAAQMGAWEIDLVSGAIEGTPQLFALFGVPDFVGEVRDLWSRTIHPEDQVTIDAAFAAAVQSGTSFVTDLRITTPEGKVRHLAARGEVLHDLNGRPMRVFGVDQDITERKEAEIALRKSESHLRTVIDNTLAFIGVLDTDGVLREANTPALELAGVGRHEVLGKPFWEAYWWTHDPAAVEVCRAAVKAGQEGQFSRHDVVVRGAGDRLITIDFLLSPVMDSAGQVEMLVVSGFDISDREAARNREQALMGEINHRTKNILTLVQAVARQTARGGHEDYITRFEERLRALSKAQDLLFHTNTDKADLQVLARSQLDHFGDLMDSRIHLSGPQVDLGADAAQSIGMALHELGTNAGKYGALSSDTGSVDVSWTVSRRKGTFEINWTEQGGPPVVAPERKGFGSTVINQMTQAVLKADVALDYAPDGLKWKLVCKFDALTAAR
jgi:PAS domain S-box-containing protein